MRVLDVFSCVGFHAIGLARAGRFEHVAFCEFNPRRRQELVRLYPEIPVHDDIRTLPAIQADIIFGGPPCQETSVAAAIHGRRTGHSLWPYMLCAGLNAGVEWFVVEQPPGHKAWEAQVSNHLSRAGYHVARFVFGAEDIGAPYPRRRVYLIACTSLPRLEIAWAAGPSAIERVKRSTMARGDWYADSIPSFTVDTWRSENVLERREAIEALGDSNPPGMAEVIGHMLSAARTPATDAIDPAEEAKRPSDGALNLTGGRVYEPLHEFVPHTADGAYGQFCDVCGYGPYETLKHIQRRGTALSSQDGGAAT